MCFSTCRIFLDQTLFRRQSQRKHCSNGTGHSAVSRNTGCNHAGAACVKGANMSRIWGRMLAICLLLGSTVLAHHAAFAAEPKRELVKVKGNLYRFINNHHASVVYDTKDGLIVGDPINREAALWLQAELQSRFSKPVRYMFYSHHHADHASGGEVFAEAGAQVIAHKNALANLKTKSVPTALPTILFDDTLTISLGESEVVLKYLGKNHTDDMIIAHFPAEEAVFAVDFVSVERLPYRNLQGGSFPDWYLSIDRLTKLPFTYLVPGHGKVGIHFDAIEHGHYLRELENRVKRAKKAGLTLEEMRNNIKLPRYQHWQNYDEWLPQNIMGMYRAVIDPDS